MEPGQAWAKEEVMLQHRPGSLRAGPWCHRRCFKPCPGWGLELRGQIWWHTDETLGKMHEPLRYIFLIDQREFEKLRNKPVTYREKAKNKQIAPRARQ